MIKPKKLNIWITKKKKKIPFIVDELTTDKSLSLKISISMSIQDTLRELFLFKRWNELTLNG